MTSQEILQADLLDLLFDNRNKEYGAYTLRKFYPGRLALALGAALGSLLVLLLLTHFLNGDKRVAPVKDDVFVTLIPIAPTAHVKVKVTPPPPRVVKATAAQQMLTTHLKMTDNTNTMPDQDGLKGKVISNITTDGLPGDLPTPPAPPAASLPPATPEAPKAELVQREPQFPGGAKAWRDFLSKYLRVPDELGAGERKTVLIRFQVASDGAVTNFEIVQSGGHSFDEEVMRVLRRMPKWTPALVNSQPVSRSFTQPVTFMAEE